MRSGKLSAIVLGVVALLIIGGLAVLLSVLRGGPERPPAAATEGPATTGPSARSVSAPETVRPATPRPSAKSAAPPLPSGPWARRHARARRLVLRLALPEGAERSHVVHELFRLGPSAHGALERAAADKKFAGKKLAAEVLAAMRGSPGEATAGLCLSVGRRWAESQADEAVCVRLRLENVGKEPVTLLRKGWTCRWKRGDASGGRAPLSRRVMLYNAMTRSTSSFSGTDFLALASKESADFLLMVESAPPAGEGALRLVLAVPGPRRVREHGGKTWTGELVSGPLPGSLLPARSFPRADKETELRLGRLLDALDSQYMTVRKKQAREALMGSGPLAEGALLTALHGRREHVRKAAFFVLTRHATSALAHESLAAYAAGRGEMARGWSLRQIQRCSEGLAPEERGALVEEVLLEAPQDPRQVYGLFAFLAEQGPEAAAARWGHYLAARYPKNVKLLTNVATFLLTAENPSREYRAAARRYARAASKLAPKDPAVAETLARALAAGAAGRTFPTGRPLPSRPPETTEPTSPPPTGEIF